MEYQFNGDVALLAGGVDEAVFIHNLYWWIRKNEANGRHFRDGRTWTYNSVKAFCQLMPFWTENQVRRIIKNLEDKGLVTVGNYNEEKCDRTRWFALCDEVYKAYESHERKPQMHLCESTNASVQTHKSYNDQIVNTDSKQDPPKPPKGDFEEKAIRDRGFDPAVGAAVLEWLRYKRERGEGYRPTGLKNLLGRIARMTELYGAGAVADAIEQSMAANWQGIVWDRLIRDGPKKPPEDRRRMLE